MNGRITQSDWVMKYLQSGRSLTPLTALRKAGIMRLAPRVLDLRKAGISITAKRVSRNGKSFASYSWG